MNIFLKKTSFLLIGIVALAAFLRFWMIGSIPPALTWDEVSWGYNAYSLGLDGKDEFGRFLPYDYLESFGDFKPPLYAYLDIIPVKIFGLTEFAVRFPSALFGVFTVLLTCFLAKELFFNSKRKEYYAFAATTFLAFSPWHINLSRAAFEANVAQFFLVLGVWAFLFAVRRNAWFLSLSAISFATSFYVFNTSRVVAPLLVVMLGIFFWKFLLKHKKESIVGVLVGAIFIAPIVGFLFSPQANLRFREVNIFSDPAVVELANQEIANDNNSALGKVLHNRRLKYAVSFVTHYFDNLTPRFLFIEGDGNPKFSTQDVGQLYIWSLPFIVGGAFLLFRKREGRWYIIPVWILLGIIPAATARETPHALRTETTLPMFQMLTAYGVVSAYFFVKQIVKRKIFFNIIVGITALLYFANVSYYLYGYYVHYSREYSGEWQYGYEEALQYAKENESSYDAIYFSTSLGRPYMYYLFFSDVTPEEFRTNSEVNRDAFGFVSVNRVGKYHFLRDADMKKGEKDTLYVVDPFNAPKDGKILKTVNKLNGEPALIIYSN